MSRILTLPEGGRLLVLAPHPDDETLATGELIQLAAANRFDVRVVFATDGDNNPWPQRWAERRWRIGPTERARWGARRRAEARVALARLGVADASMRFLGWPDLGLTDLLMRDDTAIERLAEEIGRFVPTHVAMPSMRDRHPDHGALHVMTELAIARARVSCVCLGYVVHGRSGMPDAWLLGRDAARHARKREALLAHESQISLSRKRMLRWVSEPEAFERAEPEGSTAAQAPSTRIIPLVPAHRFWRKHELLLVIADGSRIERARVPLPRIGRGDRRVLASTLCGDRASIELEGDCLRVALAPTLSSGARGYLKIERTHPRVLIFDRDTWHRLDEVAEASEPASTSHVEHVAVAHRATL